MVRKVPSPVDTGVVLYHITTVIQCSKSIFIQNSACDFVTQIQPESLLRCCFLENDALDPIKWE